LTELVSESVTELVSVSVSELICRRVSGGLAGYHSRLYKELERSDGKTIYLDVMA